MTYAIECKNISKQFGDFKALKHVDISIEEGKCVAILGPNGTGKSTLIRIMAQVMRQTEGQVFILGDEMKDDNPELRSKLGLLSHTGYLYSTLSAEENLQFYANMYNLKNPDNRISELLEKVGLKHRRYDRVGTFSRGMTQRLGIARALLHKPAVLLLDEPETGLDREGLDLLWDIVKTDDPNRTVIFTSHNFQSVIKACDETVIMQKGKIVDRREKNNMTEPELQELYNNLVGGSK